ncbi:hypothetical protein ACR6C2_08410 [Streptomyces sp. INA 01156]
MTIELLEELETTSKRFSIAPTRPPTSTAAGPPRRSPSPGSGPPARPRPSSSPPRPARTVGPHPSRTGPPGS